MIPSDNHQLNAYSKTGSLSIKPERPQKPAIYSSAIAHININIENTEVNGIVNAEHGNVKANQCKLFEVKAKRNIELIDSSAKNLFSENDLTVTHSHIDGKVRSVSGNLKAKDSDLNVVVVENDIELINTCVHGLLLSEHGDVKVSQNDKVHDLSSISAYKSIFLENTTVSGKIKSFTGGVFAKSSKLESVNANGSISLINSSATSLHSENGMIISVEQTDLKRRKISTIDSHGYVIAKNCELNNVICHNRAFIINSVVDNITFILDSQHEGELDLTHTEISGKVSIKVEKTFTQSIKNLFSFQKTDRFTVLIKGQDNLKHFSFENYQIITEKTDNGLLVTGHKNKSLSYDFKE